MGIETRQKFDGYAAKYDEWFMKNENLFTSEASLPSGAGMLGCVAHD